MEFSGIFCFNWYEKYNNKFIFAGFVVSADLIYSSDVYKWDNLNGKICGHFFMYPKQKIFH